MAKPKEEFPTFYPAALDALIGDASPPAQAGGVVGVRTRRSSAARSSFVTVIGRT